MARRRGPLSELKRGLRHMYPNRVAARFISGGKHQTFTSIAKAPFKPGRTYRMADEAKLTAARRAVAPSQRGRAGGKKAAGKRPDPYAAAAQIPARNRTQAAKQASAAKKATAKKATFKQGKDGRMQGSVTLPGADLTHYNAAKSGNAVIQPGEPNRRRL